LVFDVGILRLGSGNKFLNTRQRAPGGGSAGLNGFIGAVEIVPRERLNIGAENQVCVTFPYFELVFLGGADSAAYDLKNVGRSSAVTIFETDRNSHHVCRAQFAGGAGRNLRDKTTIGEVTRSDLNRFEQSWKSAAGANRFAQVSARENYRFAVSQVRSDHRHGDSQILEALGFEDLFNQVPQTVIAGQP
jgi:hypothetical protein